VQLAGRLVADPDLKYTPSGKAVCRTRLATNDTKVAQFHDIVAWQGVAETAAESLRKGAAVTVEGRLQTRTWQRRRLAASGDGGRRQQCPRSSSTAEALRSPGGGLPSAQERSSAPSSES
jgi:single-strand DNA-binding protein